MESFVFRDSPLAQYLEGEGESLAGLDWAADHEHDGSSTTSSEPQTFNFAPSSLTVPKTRKKALRPLQIQNPHWYKRASVRDVMRGGLKSRLASGENLQFVERFRYILVASQLLNEQASVANYDLRDTSALPTPSTAAANVESSFSIVTWFGNPSPRFYAYTAASIIILSILISYLSRGGSERKLAFGKSRAAITVLLSMALALLVFAHMRRKKLRNLRTDAISSAEAFVENCQMFDVVVANAITLIQEIELVSRGYRLSQPLPPITRLERADSSRKCARLRRTIAESFRLSIPPICRAIEALASYPKRADLEKFYDIYDIRTCDLQDASCGIDEAEFEDMEDLKALKTLFQRLYVVRKIFLCHLLALEANGGHRDHMQWRAVGEQLYTLQRLMADLAIEAKGILTDETDFKIPPTPQPATPNTATGMSAANRERLRQQLRKFNGLSATARGLQAKMHLIREATDKALQTAIPGQDGLAEGFRAELLGQYDEIGIDLRGLLAEWETGRASLAAALDKMNTPGSPASSRPASMAFSAMGSPGMSTAGTLVGGSPRTSCSWDESERDAILRKRISVGSDFQRPTASGDEEEIFEAMSEPAKGRERSKLTREERIAKMKEERQHAMEARKKTEASVNLVRELRNVLETRAAYSSSTSGVETGGALPLKRRSLPAARSRLSLELIKVAEANREANSPMDGRQSAPITPATRIAPVAVTFPPPIAPTYEEPRKLVSPVEEVD
ncbi:hypothetical protein H072_882 [Dactylellina haptotyla CBS 200.50]|uniref:Vezatin n=1 Tax=Dactylellina haptotyla (strain CBS 200.50) TaxID=1284197 RepID=S8AQ54_DACHA|nr:hypothetical protein H072_882 [Dactylellina haptotyla CBS 200.50]